MRLDCITINTDASFCTQTKVSAWAFTIVSDAFRINKSGVFKDTPGSSINAEALCIGNALTKTLRVCNDQFTAKYVIINTDCKTVESAIANGKRNENLVKVQSIIGKVNLKLKPEILKFRHVKSHTGKQDKRSLANDWCDITSKKLMKEERHKKLKSGKIIWKKHKK